MRKVLYSEGTNDAKRICEERGVPYVFFNAEEISDYSSSYPFPILDTAPKGWENWGEIEILGVPLKDVTEEIQNYEDEAYNSMVAEEFQGYQEPTCAGYSFNSAKTRILVFKKIAVEGNDWQLLS